MIDWLDNPLVTAVLGFMGGMWGLIGLEVWRERRRADRVRTMLRQEIAQNIASLTFMDHQLPSFGLTHGDQPGPVLERLVWTTQMPVLPSVLGDREIVVLSGFYDGVRRILVLSDVLAEAGEATSRPPADPGARPSERIGAGNAVEQGISQAYADIRTLIPRTIKAGTLGFEMLGLPH